MERFQELGFFLIGVAAVIYTLSHAYVDISYMLIDKSHWEMTP